MGQGWSVRGWLVWLSVACAVMACEDESPTDSTGGSVDGMDGGGMDARVDSSVATETWIADKTTLDVWWPGSAYFDPLRGAVELVTLRKSDGTCEHGRSPTTSKICGLKLPTYTSDPICTAYAISIPDRAWESPHMPGFDLLASAELDAGDTTTTLTAAFLGIAPLAWPPPEQVDMTVCEAGTGVACFPDHDDDGFPGVTANVRADNATYEGTIDDGLCANPNLPNATAYRYDTLFTSWPGPFPCPGCGIGPDTRANALHLGLFVRQEMSSNATCANHEPPRRTPVIAMRVVRCGVDPSSLDPGHPPYSSPDPRIASHEYTCTPSEANLLDRELPQLRVLAAGEAPGDTPVPLGWIIKGRDIDRTPSEGTRTESITLHVEDIDAGSDGEPSCAQVRAVFGNE